MRKGVFANVRFGSKADTSGWCPVWWKADISAGARKGWNANSDVNRKDHQKGALFPALRVSASELGAQYSVATLARLELCPPAS
jgi:hypothetical protein